MTTARALIDGLSGEKIRWTTASKTFESQIHKLVGDVLLATGFLSYAGPFNQEFRKQLMKNWKKEMSLNSIPFSEVTNTFSAIYFNQFFNETIKFTSLPPAQMVARHFPLNPTLSRLFFILKVSHATFLFFSTFLLSHPFSLLTGRGGSKENAPLPQ